MVHVLLIITNRNGLFCHVVSLVSNFGIMLHCHILVIAHSYNLLGGVMGYTG